VAGQARSGSLPRIAPRFGSSFVTKSPDQIRNQNSMGHLLYHNRLTASQSALNLEVFLVGMG
jgi:hypothetical protein